MPMATPAAPHASAATRPRPSVNPPAASTGMSTASTTCGSSSEVGIVPVWPPPSAPWAMTASTPHSATFSACRGAPTVGMVTTPASRSCFTRRSPGAWAKLATRTRSRMSSCDRGRRCRPGRRAGSRRTVGRCGSWTSWIASSSWSKVIVADARMPSPPAALVADVSRAPATQPIPVCTIGYCTPNRSHAAVCSARVRHAGTSLLRRPFGSITSRMSRSSSSVGSRDSGTSSGITSSKPVAATTSSTVTPGCTERSRMR